MTKKQFAVKRYTFTMILIAILTAVLFIPTSSMSQPYGLQLPFPKSIELETPTRNLPFYINEKQIIAILEIDKKGKVKSITAESKTDSNLVAYFSENLKSIKFESGKLSGKKKTIMLPVRLHFEQRRKLPEILFPIDTNGIVTDRNLFDLALRLNKIELPQLVTFPPYFSDLKWSDSLEVYPYCLHKVEIDSSGVVTSIEEVANTTQTFASQIKSAILYAKFSPAKLENKKVASTFYLLVSFFHQIHFPNQGWDLEKLPSYDLMYREQVKILSDTVGLLNYPILKKPKANEYVFGGEHEFYRDTVQINVTIGENGKISTFRMSKSVPRIRISVVKLLKQLSFYPAMSYSGNPVSYSGLMSMEFIGSSKIRINYHWFDE